MLKSMAVGAATLSLPNSILGKTFNTGKNTHIVTLSFDDGFRKSSIKTAEIYEKYNLYACINVIATAHLRTSELPKIWDKYPAGDFVLWNELKARGHEIMPHGYRHARLDRLPFKQANDLILRCLEYFSKNLKGFEPEKSIFNFPYGKATTELEEWASKQVRAYRVRGQGINSLPHKDPIRIASTMYGPSNCEKHLEREIEKLLARPSGWLIYNTHGLDGEGWGPIRSSFLDNLLNRLVSIKSVEIMPAGKVLS
jgi:peptidoglycan/xylan/chitin deacetylase (PgdA/CDA1 family)